MRIRIGMFFLTGLLLATQANAQVVEPTWWEPKIYAGLGGGSFTLENNDFDDFKEDSTAWELFVGLQFNKYFSVEVGWMDGGSPTMNSNEAGFEFNDRIENRALHASAIGSWPFNETVSVYVRGGLSSWRTSVHQTIEGLTPAGDQFIVQYFPTEDNAATTTGTDPFYGIGFAINIDSGMLRVEYDLSSVDAVVFSPIDVDGDKYSFDANLIWLSIAWRFGL